jgi:hypothetical protein
LSAGALLVRGPGLEREEPKGKEVQARKDGEEAPSWMMTSATKEFCGTLSAVSATERTFQVVFVGENQGVGVMPEDEPDKGRALPRQADYCHSIETLYRRSPHAAAKIEN